MCQVICHLMCPKYSSRIYQYYGLLPQRRRFPLSLTKFILPPARPSRGISSPSQLTSATHKTTTPLLPYFSSHTGRLLFGPSKAQEEEMAAAVVVDTQWDFSCDLEVNFESEENASVVYAALAVDKELQPDRVKRLMSVSNSKLSVHFEAAEARFLRASFSAFVDALTLATKTIEELGNGLKVNTCRPFVQTPWDEGRCR